MDPKAMLHTGKVRAIARGMAFAATLGAPLGGKAADLAAPDAVSAQANDWLAIDLGAAAVTDLRFRGVSYSDGKPAVYGYAQARIADWLYAGMFASTVDFPARYGLSDPDMKLNFWGGLKHQWDNFGLESGFMYYYYPGERPFPGARQTDYWEIFANPTFQITSALSIAATINWTSDWLNTDAHATYLSVTPKLTLDPMWGGKVQPYVSGGVGALLYRKSDYFSAAKDYLDWNVGAGFTVNNTTFDVRYVDTNLKRSECTVDVGHRSWCGATVIGKVAVDFTLK
jgi:uncharacterized protein (TIGR02001 family)